MTTNLQTLNERIAEKIGAELIDLIPPDQWQEIVDKEILKFRTETAPRLIHEALKQAYVDQVKAVVSSFTHTDTYREASQDYINKALHDLIAESSGTIFAGMITPAMQMVMQDLRSRLGY